MARFAVCQRAWSPVRHETMFAVAQGHPIGPRMGSLQSPPRGRHSIF